MPTTEPFRTQYQGKWRTRKHSKPCFQETLLGSSLLKIFENLRRKWDRYQRSQVRPTYDGRINLQQVLELEEREMIIMKSRTATDDMPLNKTTSAASCLLTKNNSIGVKQESIKRIIWKYHDINQDTSLQVPLPFLFSTFWF